MNEIHLAHHKGFFFSDKQLNEYYEERIVSRHLSAIIIKNLLSTIR